MEIKDVQEFIREEFPDPNTENNDSSYEEKKERKEHQGQTFAFFPVLSSWLVDEAELTISETKGTAQSSSSFATGNCLNHVANARTHEVPEPGDLVQQKDGLGVLLIWALSYTR